MTSIESNRVADRESLDIDLFQYLSLLKKRWLIIVAIMMGSLGLSLFMAFSQKASYEADGKLLIEADRTSSLTGYGEGVGEFDPLVNAQNPLSTEIEILTSRPIMEQVINRLSLVDSSGNALSARSLQKRLTAKILGGADIIKLVYEGPDAEEAAAVVNTLADIYIESNLQSNQSEAAEARELIARELPQSEAFVRESESALRRFKEENRIVSLSEEARSTVQILEDLDTQILNTQIALDEATVESTQLRDNLGLTMQQALVVSELSQSPAVQGALAELQEIERQKAIEQGFYTDESPVIQHFQDQEVSLRSLLQQEMAVVLGQNGQIPERFWQVGELQQSFIADFVDAEVSRLSLTQRLQSLESVSTSYNSRADALPQLEQTQSELERRLEVATASYQTLLQRLQELQTAENQAVGNARLIEPAIVPDKTNSSKKLVLLLGLVAGAFLSTTVVTILEISDAYRRRKSVSNYAEPELYPQPSVMTYGTNK